MRGRDTRMMEALRKLPPRQPRGSPGNLIRATMLPFLLQGMSAEEAKEAARAKLKEMFHVLFEEEK